MKSAVGWPVGLGSSLLAALAAHRNLSHSHGLPTDPTQPAVKQGGSGENGGGASPVFQLLKLFLSLPMIPLLGSFSVGLLLKASSVLN